MPIGNLVITKSLYDHCKPELREKFEEFLAQGSDVLQHEEAGSERYAWRMNHPDFLPDDEDGEYMLYFVNRVDLHHDLIPTLASLRRVSKDGRQTIVKTYLVPSSPFAVRCCG